MHFIKNRADSEWFDSNLLQYSMCGSVAEWSKALVLGTSLFGGVGSNPTTAINILYSWCDFQKENCEHLISKSFVSSGKI